MQRPRALGALPTSPFSLPPWPPDPRPRRLWGTAWTPTQWADCSGAARPWRFSFCMQLPVSHGKGSQTGGVRPIGRATLPPSLSQVAGAPGWRPTGCKGHAEAGDSRACRPCAGVVGHRQYCRRRRLAQVTFAFSLPPTTAAGRLLLQEDPTVIDPTVAFGGRVPVAELGLMDSVALDEARAAAVPLCCRAALARHTCCLLPAQRGAPVTLSLPPARHPLRCRPSPAPGPRCATPPGPRPPPPPSPSGPSAPRPWTARPPHLRALAPARWWGDPTRPRSTSSPPPTALQVRGWGRSRSRSRSAGSAGCDAVTSSDTGSGAPLTRRRCPAAHAQTAPTSTSSGSGASSSTGMPPSARSPPPCPSWWRR